MTMTEPDVPVCKWWTKPNDYLESIPAEDIAAAEVNYKLSLWVETSSPHQHTCIPAGGD